MNTKEYNGWTNYETWLLKLWQDNEQGEQEFWRDQAEEIVKIDGRKEGVRVMADLMKEHYAEQADQRESGFWLDLLTAALSEVNWFEIAEHWIDEAADALDLEGCEVKE